MELRTITRTLAPRLRRIGATCVAAAVAASDALAQPAYPARPVTIVSVGPAGGVTDQAARLIATKVGARLGQTVIVDDRGGAGGNIGAEYASKAAPDGYTLMVGTQGTQSTNQFLFKSLRFNPEKDFVPVHGIISLPNVLVVNASRPYRSVGEFVAYARTHPGKVTAASGGNGTGMHLAIEQFRSVAGVDLVHVPYKGSPPAITDLVSGQVDLCFDYPATTVGHIRSGKLRALAVLGPNRLPQLPQVPTIAEAGFPRAESTDWIGLFAVAGTPQPIVDRWTREVALVLQGPDVIASFERMGGVPLPLGGEQFGSFIVSERVKWKAVIERTGARIE
ncbi:Tripartite tricarboxylate transporter substrate binding protein [Cupriavidus necator]|uniref:Probable extra-cytoplasmic solute receptor n=1 Tax=Cupriavidus necator (strain ATCC 17699 / DSM 428 / KCTC 22496 / NCIMB 10442 / H16 / Stanier 337) TaxID=381666 RepID=Q0K458_CUPNH|nr:tripartite tricarboxylate transporter substrate binding protein [Cupriavidus necator]QCC03137.1 tripartite tricarboxylate transporter substrate binding protein [Cupriavidus necator H16]QQB80194.1 tripartite tricarboxylate transporter substrate binding protein [Cupriavidus necator]WKA44460.1 tripartite tricarboxylate transporter substrate binding protein [Cupriavidus necator]CAJ95216.1 probable extra-cytoplasmic solute receptor [Cupriavidus necator H16]